MSGVQNKVVLVTGAASGLGLADAQLLTDGGAKVVMVSGDILNVKSNTASSADVWVSVVDAIST